VRKTEDKYSYVAAISEVEENDYNLNIPRYVDTFEEEEEIDIETVAAEIQTLDIDLEENETLISSFCKELNIKTPF
jgi:type I restriction enzyme M protein